MVDVLAIGAHPDDIEIFAGASVARLRRSGASIGLLHLTRGEAGTRGSAELRHEEATTAAETLDAAELRILDLGDGLLRDDDARRAAVVDVIREWKPRLLLAPHPHDDHPDHEATGRITKAACFLAGVAKAPGAAPAEPHRPGGVWYYPSHEWADPTFVVAVSDEDVDRKLRAIACYGSQVYDPDSAEPETRISTESYQHGLRARLRYFGSLIGADWGEPFLTIGPLAVPRPESLLP